MKTILRILFAASFAALGCQAQTTPPRINIHAESVTRDTPNSDDFFVIDGATGGTAKTHANEYVRTNGSYADPSWIPSFAWSKITAPPTTLAGYGITDAQPLNTSNLSKLAALSGTNVLYYRDGSGNWSTVTIGSNLTFSAGTLSATGGGSGSGDVSSNTTTTVDSEVALFSSTGGKTIKRATGTGVAHLASGVLSAAPVNLASEVGSTILPVANGGTGTTTPGLVAGTNVTVSGTFPNQTVNATAGSGGYATVQSSGSSVTTRTTLNFTGSGVSVADNSGSGRTDVTITSGSGVDMNPFSGWTPANSNVIFIGDSISLASDSNNWTHVIQTLPSLSGKANFYWDAVAGSKVGDHYDPGASLAYYNAHIATHKPIGPITRTAVFLRLGTNDAGFGDTAGFKSAWDGLIDQLRSDGFGPIIAITSDARTDVTGTEQRQQQISAYILHSNKPDFVYPVHLVFTDPADSLYRTDLVHYTPTGNAFFAQKLDLFLRQGGWQVKDIRTAALREVHATDAESVPTNAMLNGTARSYTAAQGYTVATLTDPSSGAISWDGLTQTWAHIDIAANRTLGPLQNPTRGVMYHLEVKRTIANKTINSFDAIYTGPGTTATQSTAANAVDFFDGFYDGTSVVLFLRGAYAGSGGSSSTLLIDERFSGGAYDSDALGQFSSGAGYLADTTDVPGARWDARDYDHQWLYDTTTHRAKGGGGSSSFMDVGVADGTLQATIYATAKGGLFVRQASDGSGVALIVDPSLNQWSLAEVSRDGLGSILLNTLASGSMTIDTSAGNILKINTSGTTVKAYVDGALKTTQTSSVNATSTKNVGMLALGTQPEIDNLTFSTP